MYIKNIDQLFKEQIPIKFRLSEGSSIYGKIISQEGKYGLIKLYDGTIIPSIFLSENKLVNDKYIKFLIDQIDQEGLILKVIDDSTDFQGEDSINALINKLNIPREEGTKIINSLIRFNLPATDENIMKIYKNISFLESLGKMKDNDILSFLHNYLKGDITSESKEFSTAKEIFTKLLKIDRDFLSFLIENDIPYNIENMLNSSNFLDDKFSINNIINTLKNLLEAGNDNTHPVLFNDLVNVKKDLPTVSFNCTIKEILDKPEVLNLLPNGILSSFNNDLDILKYLSNNYNIYFFNSYSNDKIFKNNIIIKHKYKSSSNIDPDDVKVFITVETPNIGIVESYLYKKGKNLTLSFKTEEKYIDLFKKNIEVLNKLLKDKGYEVINISVGCVNPKTNLVSLSNFFNDTIFRELDVRV